MSGVTLSRSPARRGEQHVEVHEQAAEQIDLQPDRTVQGVVRIAREGDVGERRAAVEGVELPARSRSASIT